MSAFRGSPPGYHGSGRGRGACSLRGAALRPWKRGAQRSPIERGGARRRFAEVHGRSKQQTPPLPPLPQRAGTPKALGLRFQGERPWTGPQGGTWDARKRRPTREAQRRPKASPSERRRRDDRRPREAHMRVHETRRRGTLPTAHRNAEARLLSRQPTRHGFRHEASLRVCPSSLPIPAPDPAPFSLAAARHRAGAPNGIPCGGRRASPNTAW